MTYKLINRKTGEEHICSKETVNGFDFYIGGVIKDINESNVWDTTDSGFHPFLKSIGSTRFAIDEFEKGNFLKVIATNDPSKEIPQVVDVAKKLALEVNDCIEMPDKKYDRDEYYLVKNFIDGYNDSQQTHPYSDDDMKKFVIFCFDAVDDSSGKYVNKTNQELLEMWKEERIKTIYYE